MLTFSQRVVKIALSIPEGRVTTYGRIAKASGGGAMASRSITAILGKAYAEGEKAIPFHRIVYSNGRVWIDEKYRKIRMALYKKEGIRVDQTGKIVDFADIVWEFK
jgi:methylated-DNA-protein-cysteine methyltransferase-like protein